MLKTVTRLLVLAACATSALAQQGFPGSAPITLMVPYPPGGVSDYFARVLAPRLGESIGASVVVENRPGANGAIGTAVVARARPDGHMIGLVPASTVTSNQWLQKDMPFDPLKDLQALAITLIVPNVLVVHPAVPAKSVPELLDLIRGKPGAMNYASVGMGSSSHLQGEMLANMAKLNMVHVAYKGAGPAMQALVAGQVQLAFENLPAAFPYIQSGQVRALATTSAASPPQAPDLPPLGKFLPGFEATPWFGLVGPAGLPKEIVAKLNEHIVKAARSPEVSKALETRGGQTVGTTPDEMARTMREESEKMRKLIKEAGIKVD